MKFEDKSGRDVKPGDLIVYGHALGRCAGLQYGKVLNLQMGKSFGLEKSVKLKVQGVDSDWDEAPPKLLKTTVLSFSERILVVSREQIPDSILRLLDGVKHVTK